MRLVVLGDSESGKTSTLSSLLSQSDKAPVIAPDARTVGMVFQVNQNQNQFYFVNQIKSNQVDPALGVFFTFGAAFCGECMAGFCCALRRSPVWLLTINARVIDNQLNQSFSFRNGKFLRVI